MDISCHKGCFLAQAADVESLVRERDPFFSGRYDWVQIPMETIFDMVTTGNWSASQDGYGPCANQVQRNLDRLARPLHDVFYDVTIAMQRRVLRIGASEHLLPLRSVSRHR